MLRSSRSHFERALNWSRRRHSGPAGLGSKSAAQATGTGTATGMKSAVGGCSYAPATRGRCVREPRQAVGKGTAR